MRPTHFNNRHRPIHKPRSGERSWNRPSGNGRSQPPKANLHRNLEKYLSSAREAARNGDKIAAEGFYQHAEHYQRLINRNQGGRNADTDGMDGARSGGRGSPRAAAESSRESPVEPPVESPGESPVEPPRESPVESEGREVGKESEVAVPAAANPKPPQPPPTDF